MYCAKADLLKIIPLARLIELTDDAQTGAADDGVINDAIRIASGEIDARVCGRYAVPLNPVPDAAKDYCAAMSVYHLFARRLGAPEEWRKRYEDSVSFLSDVAARKAHLPGLSEQSGSSPSGGSIEFSGPPRVFGRDSMKGF